jgi:hypothetical protein
LPEPPAVEHEAVCLLYVRSGGHDVSACLDSLSGFVDAVVALDGSGTDDTHEVLKQHSLVKTALSMTPQDRDSGGRESARWTRLLEAADLLRPKWILCLNAGERISAEDGEAIRRLLRDEAIRGAAYGFRVQETGIPRDLPNDGGPWAFRLFSYRGGQRFPRAAPMSTSTLVPTDIPREHWIKTTLRIEKSGTVASDPRPSVPAVGKDDAQASPLSDADIRRSFEQPLNPNRPAISAIVISQNDRGRIAQVMDALVSQKVDQPVELILVNSGRDGTAEFVRDNYPQVRVIHLPEPALPGKARNAGLRIARGDFITFPGSHIVLPPGALQKRLDAHENGYAMVCGAVVNGSDTRAGWASYFLDHSGSLPGRPSRVLRLPPSRCSYSRGPLVAIGGFSEDRRVGEDTVANNRLFELGYRAYHSLGFCGTTTSAASDSEEFSGSRRVGRDVCSRAGRRSSGS